MMATPDLFHSNEEIEVTEKKTHQPQSTDSNLNRIVQIQIQSDAEDHNNNIDIYNDDNLFAHSQTFFDPITFSPPKSVDNDKNELTQIIKLNSKENVIARLYRLLVIAAFLCFLLPIIQVTHFELFQCLAFAELFLMLGYAAHLFGILFYAHFHKETGLYRIYTLNSMPKNWARMSFSYRALLYKTQPIESISEFSAIQGGLASTMLFGTATATLAVIACAFAADMQYEKFVFVGTDICILLGSFGLVTIGTFELDPWNDLMKKLHYLGVVLSVGIFAGFNWQQYRTIWKWDIYNQCSSLRMAYPIFLDIIALIGFISWQISLRKGKEFQKDLLSKGQIEFDSHIISKFSLINLVSEGIFFIGAGLTLCSWLFFYPINKECRNHPELCCNTLITKLSGCE